MNIYQLTVWYRDDSDETILFSSIQSAEEYVKGMWKAVAQYEIYEPTGNTNSNDSLEMRCLVSGPSIENDPAEDWVAFS